MRRTPQNQSIHDEIVKVQVATYQSQGYSDIKAAHINYLNGQPYMVFGHIPDVMAQKNGRITICEVETSDSLADSSTIEQWKAFDRSGYEFHVAVPQSALNLAETIAKQNNISVDYYWYNGNY